MDRATKRAKMNAQFDSLPEWLRNPFVPFRDASVVLLDRGEDKLAAQTVSAINHPATFSAEQVAAFDQVKAGILAGIQSLISDDPLQSPEALELLATSQQRREGN